MQGELPQKASVFAYITRDDGRVYCTHEARGQIGLPGGKWEPETDPARWIDVLQREFQEEIGVELPASSRRGYLEWGGGCYQIRFVTLRVDDDTAGALPVKTLLTTDPDKAVTSADWYHPKQLLGSKNVRPHIRAAISMIAAMGAVFRRELYRGDGRDQGAQEARDTQESRSDQGAQEAQGDQNDQEA